MGGEVFSDEYGMSVCTNWLTVDVCYDSSHSVVITIYVAFMHMQPRAFSHGVFR